MRLSKRPSHRVRACASRVSLYGGASGGSYAGACDSQPFRTVPKLFRRNGEENCSDRSEPLGEERSIGTVYGLPEITNRSGRSGAVMGNTSVMVLSVFEDGPLLDTMAPAGRIEGRPVIHG